MKHATVIIVGAGPGGLSVAGALADKGIHDILLLERGTVGQSWLEYPTATHLLSESVSGNDENMVAGVPTSDTFPFVPHPSHILYQKYLAHVATEKKFPVQENTTVVDVMYNPQEKKFFLTTKDNEELSCQFLVWAAGMYSTPNENLESEGCFIHYAHMPYLEDITSDEVTVVGSANGASGVVMQLAKPGRKLHLVVSREYIVEEPIDSFEKQQMKFVQDLAKQGLVEIIENFRVKRIYPSNGQFVLESEDGQTRTAAKKPIVCTGFLPNIEPIKQMIQKVERDHGTFLDIDESHQSKQQPGLYVAGTISKTKGDEGMISKFREFSPLIAESIHRSLS